MEQQPNEIIHHISTFITELSDMNSFSKVSTQFNHAIQDRLNEEKKEWTDKLNSDVNRHINKVIGYNTIFLTSYEHETLKKLVDVYKSNKEINFELYEGDIIMMFALKSLEGEDRSEITISNDSIGMYIGNKHYMGSVYFDMSDFRFVDIVTQEQLRTFLFEICSQQICPIRSDYADEDEWEEYYDEGDEQDIEFDESFYT